MSESNAHGDFIGGAKEKKNLVECYKETKNTHYLQWAVLLKVRGLFRIHSPVEVFNPTMVTSNNVFKPKRENKLLVICNCFIIGLV